MTKKKIAIIDDEKDLCFLIRSILESTGSYDVFFAHDGRAGIELCVREEPDLIFLDFIMPLVKGDQVIQYIKDHPPGNKPMIVLMSGSGPEVEKVTGADIFLAKPFSRDELLGITKRILAAD